MKRLRITIAAGAADLADFPVVVRLPEAAAAGGLTFTDSQGRELPSVPFGTPGESLVRVLLPEVAAAADTVFFAAGGGSGSGGSEDPFTRSCRFPVSEESPQATDKSSEGNRGGSALTVESWIHAGESRAEQMQVIASQWPLAAALKRFATYDAGATDGLETRGFFGAMCDGRYVYFSPQCNTAGRHGTALRYDTHGGFDDPGSWSAYDAGRTLGLDTTGYYGVACTGRYVYYVPRHNSAGKLHSVMLRYDAGNGDFRDPAAWAAFDFGVARSSQGCAFDGRYLYYVPGYDGDGGGGGSSGLVIRYDTTAPFAEAGSYETWDAGDTGGVACSCYDGAVFDGRHVYFAPLGKRGNMLRYDTRRPFREAASWEAHDIRGATDPPIAMCVGAVFDGRHVYYVPYGDNTAVVRFDTEAPFDAGAGWESRDVAGTSGLDCRGFDGALFDGRHVYFIPFYNGGADESGFHCELLRYDTSKGFADEEAWSAADGSLLAPPNPGGFNGGAFDGPLPLLRAVAQGRGAGRPHRGRHDLSARAGAALRHRRRRGAVPAQVHGLRPQRRPRGLAARPGVHRQHRDRSGERARQRQPRAGVASRRRGVRRRGGAALHRRTARGDREGEGRPCGQPRRGAGRRARGLQPSRRRGRPPAGRGARPLRRLDPHRGREHEGARWLRPRQRGGMMSVSDKVRYAELRPQEFRERLAQRPLAYLPLGTLEWHGEQLPLGSDAIISEGVMCECARRFGGIVLPPVHLGPDRAAPRPAGGFLQGMDMAGVTAPNRQLDGSCYWV